MARLEDFDYELPEQAIAQTPLEDRAAARLLWLHRATGALEHRAFRDVPDLLRPGDLLVLNDTRVTALRLLGRRPTGGQVELLLLERFPDGSFGALARPGKRLRPGTRVEFDSGLVGFIEESLKEGQKRVRFNDPSKIEAVGAVPLPPYIHVPLSVPERYQTVYASAPGSAAAPTAGLHFTQELLARLQERGVDLAYVTLDVGLDTFRPIRTENLEEHVMHGELCTLPAETATAVEECTGRIVAVGTTTVRTLETFAVGRRAVEAGTKRTQIFIRPGYQLSVVDGMFTNFHMPRTSMLAMLAALVGTENLMASYREAVRAGYRFLSFGDSMLIL